jgi:hypothetical protein
LRLSAAAPTHRGGDDVLVEQRGESGLGDEPRAQRDAAPARQFGRVDDQSVVRVERTRRGDAQTQDPAGVDSRPVGQGPDRGGHLAR